MNFIFISPQFPHTYWLWCNRLKKNGVNVLGIGDTPYDELSYELKSSLNEYYKVSNMENYDEVFRAVAFFSFKYGKIDWIESNNEYWLTQDARLRTDFNITTGADSKQVQKYRYKSAMKKYYEEAGVPTARYLKVTTIDKALAFADEVSYPVFAKPDNGVGAFGTYKIENKKDMEAFFNDKPNTPYIMEEFITGDIYSYDAIINSKYEPLFESMSQFPPSISEIVNKSLDLAYYTAADVNENLRKLGRATVKAFKVNQRFVHMEFFRLTKAKKGLGKKGDFIGLEVNMRPAGGYTPDMMNFAHATDVYQIWADMVTYDERRVEENGLDHYCVFASRRDIHNYVHSHDEIMAKYGDKIVMNERMPDVLAGTMGNYLYTAHAQDEEAAKEFIAFVQEQA
ncbi:MAG: ATP-grasp domain-containing protein [Sphaerochaetaceae bacterium]|nr:ATP-grasp domain-containing protein [Sphaerochaetaceae bacterium]